jgi:DnaJ-domain-containing protein 1
MVSRRGLSGSLLYRLELFREVQYKTASIECQSHASFLTKSCVMMLLRAALGAWSKFGKMKTMKGKITAQPLAELIREISVKGLSGTLRLEHERAQTAVYFDQGELVYAASNLRTLRLRDYLSNRSLVSKERTKLENNLSDLDLAAALAATGTVRQKDLDALLAILVSDVLRVALLWTEGIWDFNERARLANPVRVNVDTPTLLREAAQRMPLNFVSQRFRNATEPISRVSDVSPTSNLLPAESFILSRLDKPLAVADLVSLSGLPELDAQRVIYGLALSGLLKREYWKNAFRTEGSQTKEQTNVPRQSAITIGQVQQSDNWISASIENEDLERFLQRLRKATNHYEVIELPLNADPSEIKEAYYAMARRYHPDRFHLKSGTKLHAQISSAFAQVTQAYETLTNPNTRSVYDQTLERSTQFAQSAAKADETARATDPLEEFDREADGSETEFGRAEYSFREGFGALQQGRINEAIKHLAIAARLAPLEARYRAQYGRALAASETTRRLAENEIQAAVKLAPANVTFRTMLAELYFELKFLRRAQTELDRALAIDPKNATAHSLLRKLEKSRKVG